MKGTSSKNNIAFNSCLTWECSPFSIHKYQKNLVCVSHHFLVPRDFTDDLNSQIAPADPTFEVSFTGMWSENSPEKKEAMIVDSAMGVTEDQISKLETHRSDAAWQSDTLKLAKDAAMCAKLLQAANSNERTDRLAKITHIKEQNRVGANLIAKFSQQNCYHVTTSCSEADGQLSQATLTSKLFNKNIQKHDPQDLFLGSPNTMG